MTKSGAIYRCRGDTQRIRWSIAGLEPLLLCLLFCGVCAVLSPIVSAAPSLLFHPDDGQVLYAATWGEGGLSIWGCAYVLSVSACDVTKQVART